MSALVRFTSFGPRPTTGTLRQLARGRGLRLLLRTALMALAAAALAAGGLEAAAGLLAMRSPSAQLLATAGASETWTEINHPLALYGLAGTEFSKLPATYRARRRGLAGTREDVMSFGTLDGAKPYLQVSLLRHGATGEASTDGLADALARLAGTRGLTTTRIRAAAPVETRLGQIESADLLLWEGGAATPCLGFRGPMDGVGVLHVAGFACGVPGQPMGRAALACAIDRIDLLSAGDDVALRAVFVAAERREGSSCPGSPALAAARSLMPVGRHLGWLDPGGVLPPLRGLFAATIRGR